ncbi:MAG TPA: pyridoxamine 5'-phosphate oxidase family protein [Euzebya sp.]|nr:pyridoxamine 5'-phosphate oxidase family protein [Euzebya sp.]
MTETGKLFDVIDDFDTCIMTTFTADGTPHGRPMHVARREGHTLWFLTNVDSPKVLEVADDDPVVLTFQSQTDWVAATGSARITQSADRVAELWSAPMRAWLPDGPSKPGVAAMSVELHSAEYWSMSAGDLVSFAFGVARSIVSRQPIDRDPEGEHGDVRL